MPRATTVQILVPGLLGPLPPVGVPEPPAPWTARVLARGRPAAAPPGLEPALLAAFGVGLPAGADPPVAPVAYRGEGGDPGDAYWFRADPVYLRADRDRVLLMDAATADVSADEAAALTAAFNALYGDRDWQLHAPHPERWYLRLPEPPALTTTRLDAVIGHDIEPRLPEGPDALAWCGVLNEVQMLFHQHPVNETRESRGLPPLNGVWLWGGGRSPRVAAACDGLWSDEPTGRGLAGLAGCRHGSVPEGAAALPEGHHIVVIESVQAALRRGDVDGWAAAVAALEADWVAPLAGAVLRGRVRRLVLDPATGTRFGLTLASALRVWRRRRPVGRLAAPDVPGTGGV